MRVDGREISVSGSLLQPLTRRTNDVLRLVLATVFLATVITSSLVTRPRWVALEKSISQIVGVLSPTQSDTVYVVYGFAILALPFMILIGLILARQWKSLAAYAAAALMAVLPLSISNKRRPDGTSTFRTGSARCPPSCSTTRGGSRCWRQS
jgi:glycosyltransferase 2 family protein